MVDRISNPGSAQKRSVSDAIRRGFQDNFTSQQSGAGQWDPLAPATVAARAKLGWGPAGPILVRRGNLRNTWVNAGGENHVSNVRQSGSGTIFEEGASGMIASVHEFGAIVDIPSRQSARGGGTKNVGGARQVRIPARPVSLLSNRSEARIVDVIEWMINQIQSQTIGR